MSQFQASKAMVLRLLTVVKSLADRITLLRDADGDGVAETKSVFIDKAAQRRRNPLKTR